MADGDIAAEAGMDIVPPTGLVKDGYKEINKTRDYIAQFFNSISLTWEAITGKPALFPSRSDMVTRPAPATGTIEDAVNAAYQTAIAALPKAGGTVTGNLMLPNASAATSSYAAAYINGDGRISRGASSRRYKKAIRTVDPATIAGLFTVQLREFEMKDGDGSKIYGYIAEELADAGLDRFVVVVDGQIEAIDDIQLLRAQVANLNARLQTLENP